MSLGSIFGGLAPWGGEAMEWANKRQQGPQIGANPYLGNYGTLISQLEQQSRGQGPSLAGNAYNQASQDAMNQSQAMFRGGSAGAARAGARQMGQTQQGLAQGYSNARLQEQLAARMQLQQALGGASNAWFQPQGANLQAQMGQQTNGQMLLSFLQSGAGAAAKMSGAGGAGVA